MSYELKEYYQVGDDENWHRIDGNYWKAQTFESAVGFTLTRVQVKLYVDSGVAGDMHLEIWSTQGGSPDSLLSAADATVLASSITTNSAGEWVTFDFSSGQQISAGTKYAVVIYKYGANKAYWRADGTSPTYADGIDCASINGGAGWIQDSTTDFMFRTYESAVVGGGGGGDNDALRSGWGW